MTNLQKTVFLALIFITVVAGGALFAVQYLKPVFQPIPTVTDFDQATVAQIQECLSDIDERNQPRCEALLQAISSFEQCREAGFPISKNVPPTCETPDGRQFTQPGAPTLTPSTVNLNIFNGSVACLPLKDTNAPAAEVCIYGLREGDGTFYAVDTAALTPGILAKYSPDASVQIEGLMVPIEAISTDVWQKYNIKGIIQAKALDTR
jgi:hypothetical protein